MDLFARFVEERTYLKNVSPDTLRWYKGVRRVFEEILAQPTKDGMMACVQRLREKGNAAVSINTYLRGFRAYVNWLHQEGHLEKPFKVPMLKAEQKVLETLTSDQVKHILNYRPETKHDRRMHAFVCTCLDTGLRLSEALSLTRDSIDFDNLVIKVKGKGGKYRLVPFSLEGRKILYRFLNTHEHKTVFSTKSGLHITKRNVGRDMWVLGKKLGIKDIRFSPHTLRHSFACEYLRRGGNLEFLRRILGHSSILTTQKYLRSLGVDDLKAVHNELSLLSR